MIFDSDERSPLDVVLCVGENLPSDICENTLDGVFFELSFDIWRLAFLKFAK